MSQRGERLPDSTPKSHDWQTPIAPRAGSRGIMSLMSAEPTLPTVGEDKFTIRRIERGAREFLPALHLALEIHAWSKVEPDSQVTELLNDSDPHRTTVGPLFGIEMSATLVGAMAALESPGGSALIALGAPRFGAVPQTAYVSCLQAIQAAAWPSGNKLLEVLVDEGDTRAAHRNAVLRATGFSPLTQLIYLSRIVPDRVTVDCPSQSWHWLQYSDDRAELFHAALAASYAQSVDCPELTGLRSPAEILRSHRAAGLFDPARWWVALDGGRPAGIVLVNLLPDRLSAELVYLGVAQGSRGTGLAGALMARAFASVRQSRAMSLTLAVDARNTPARRLYARFDFTETMRRTAWIATPEMTRGCRENPPAEAGFQQHPR